MTQWMGQIGGGRKRAAGFGGDSIALRVWLLSSAVAVLIIGPNVWPILTLDGGLALMTLAAAAGWGAWPVAWLGFGGAPALRQACLALAIGLGATSLLTLTLGCAAVLTGEVAWGLIVAGATLGLSRLYVTQYRPAPEADDEDEDAAALPPPPRVRRRRLIIQGLLVLPLAVPTALLLIGASLPPGILWQGEARGYDVLEYHLQAPREYFEAGRIQFLPHNVYAAFPQQVEMQYLLLMHLLGDAHQAAIPSQLLHGLLGVAAVLALAAWSPRGWSELLVVLVAGATPWVAYLGCLAYVELGVLFFAATAIGVLSERYRGATTQERWQGALAAGICAGLAIGCKLTAGALVLAPLTLGLLLTGPGVWRRRGRDAALFAMAGLLALSPWLLRSTAQAGNPVYPFAYEWFGGDGWSAAQAEQWERGHALPDEFRSIAGRTRLIWRELLASDLFGPTLVILAVAGGLRRRDRYSALLAIWTGLMVLAWALLTHMPGRFITPVIAPLALLAGRALEWSPQPGVVSAKLNAAQPPRRLRTPVLLIAVCGALWNAQTLWGRWEAEQRSFRTALPRLAGATQIFLGGENWPGEALERVNAHVPADAKVWLVGQANVFYVDRDMHYATVFSRDPWVAYAARGRGPAECVAWLRSRNVTHVVFSWTEIERLRRTYGFPAQVTRAWVADLRAAGLSETFSETRNGATAYEILAVPPPRDRAVNDQD